MLRFATQLLTWAMLTALWAGCTTSEDAPADAPAQSVAMKDSMPSDAAPSRPISRLAAADTTLMIDGMPVRIRQPQGDIRADLLILPGWNYSHTDWCDKADLCTAALARGYRLVMPQMHRSIYATRYFPETRPDFARERTRPWVWDTLIATLADSFGVLTPQGSNLVAGLSTGAHGAALLALDRPAYFRAVAALSGDYDLPGIPWDKVTIGMYGPYAQHPDRWRMDNPATLAARWRTPLYLGHGTNDKVIPAQQSQLFYDTLRSLHPRLGNQLHLHLAPNAGHDYAYWGSETPALLDFFDNWLSR